MKEQVQETGAKRWFGDDFLMIQNEMLETMAALLSPFGSFILKGCQITIVSSTRRRLNSGYAALPMLGGGYKVCRVEQSEWDLNQFPVYLVVKEKTSSQAPEYARPYKDSVVREVIVEYYAVAQSSQPSHTNYIKIEADDSLNPHFKGAIQDHLKKTDSYSADDPSSLATGSALYLLYDYLQREAVNALALHEVAEDPHPDVTTDDYTLDRADYLASAKAVRDLYIHMTTAFKDSLVEGLGEATWVNAGSLDNGYTGTVYYCRTASGDVHLYIKNLKPAALAGSVWPEIVYSFPFSLSKPFNFDLWGKFFNGSDYIDGRIRIQAAGVITMHSYQNPMNLTDTFEIYAVFR